MDYKTMKKWIFEKSNLGYDYAIEAVERAERRALQKARKGEYKTYDEAVNVELSIEYNKIKNGSWSK